MINCFFCQALIDSTRGGAGNATYLCLACAGKAGKIIGRVSVVKDCVIPYGLIGKRSEQHDRLVQAHCPQCKGFHQ